MSTYKPSKRLGDIDNELERGIFLAAYRSNKQYRRRLFANGLLILKHTLRGVLFSWPLYLLPAAAFALPGNWKYLFVILLVPAVYVSALILSKGIKEDHQNFIKDRLLHPGYLSVVLFPGKYQREFENF